MEKIYMSQSGYDKLNAKIELLTKLLLEKKTFNPKETRDGYNPELEEIERSRRAIEYSLDILIQKRNNAEIIEKTNNNPKIVDLDDIITVNYVEDQTDLTFKLVGEDGNFEQEIPEISVNSPIGKAIYKKAIGDVCMYSVNGQVYNIIITNKLDLNKSDATPTL